MGTHHPRPLRAALAALAALLAAPAAAFAQDEGALVATVTAAGSGEPLAGAQVRIEGTALGGVTDGAGFLRLERVPGGEQAVRVSMLGYETARIPVSLLGGLTRQLRVELVVDPIPVDPLKATASAATWGTRMLESRGFYERKTGGVGVFMTRDDITRQNHRNLSQLLSRHARLNVSYEAFGTRMPGRPNRQGTRPIDRCQPSYFLDGVQVEYFDVNSVRPSDVEGLEIYRGASEIPPAFNRAAGGCGVVLIWTRVN